MSLRAVTASLVSAFVALIAATPADAALTWSNPSTLAPLSVPGSEIARAEFQRAADDNGNQVAAWLDTGVDGTTRAPTIITRRVGTPWSPPVAFPDDGSARNGLKLDVSANGWIALAWIAASPGGTPHGRLLTRSPQGVWSRPVAFEPPLATPNSVGTQNVSVDIGPSGEVFVGSAQATAVSPATVIASRLWFRAAGSDTFVQDPGPAGLGRVAPSFDSVGNALAFVRLPSAELGASYRPAGGSWGEPRALATADVEGAVATTVPGGSYLAAWTQVVGDSLWVQTSRGGPRGGWTAPALTKRLASAKGGSGGIVDLVTVGYRTYLVTNAADRTGPVSTSSLQVTEFTETGELSTVTNVAPPLVDAVGDGTPVDRYRNVFFGANVEGDAIATWESDAGLGSAARPAGGDWSAPENLPAGPGSTNLGIALSPAGNADAMWWDGTQLRRSTTALRNLPDTPPITVVTVNATLSTWFGARCPSYAAVWANGQRVGLPQTVGVGTRRCRVQGTFPLPDGTKPGTPVLVAVTGPGLLTTFALARATVSPLT